MERSQEDLGLSSPSNASQFHNSTSTFFQDLPTPSSQQPQQWQEQETTTGNDEIDPLIVSTLQDIQSQDYLTDLMISEQELIETEFTNYLQLIYQRLSNGLDDLQQHYLSQHPPPSSSSSSHHPTPSHPNDHHPPPSSHHHEDNLSVDSDSSLQPGQELISLILIDFQQFESKVKSEISQYLDERFTKFRASFHALKKKLIDKLYQTRIALHEYRKVIESSIKMDTKIKMELAIHQTIEQKLLQIQELEVNLTRYRSAYEMASNKGTTLEMEKMELLDKVTRLEVKLDAAEERANRANRRVVTLEEQNAELNRQVEELNSQKLLRQQMGNRKKTVGSVSGSSGGSGGRQVESKTIRRPAANHCAKCIILEDMCSQSKMEVDELRKENSEGKEQIRNFQQEIDELHTKIEILLVQQEDLRARAAAEIEAAMKLVEQSHFHQHSHSFHGDPSGVATPLDDSTVHAENESQPLEESLADKDVDPSSIPANRLQEALYLDKQLSVDSKIPTTQNSRDGHEAKQPQDEVPNLQPSASRLSMSVFPTKKEVVTLTPVPITMNAQFFEFERPSSKKNPRPAPVSTSAPSEPSLPLTPTPTIPIQSSQPLPSPSAYLQLYDDRPVTPELHPLVVSPPEVAVQIRRTSDPIDYLTASQALEKQQRLSLRLHAVATPEPTSSEQPMAQQIDTSAKSLIGASSHSPQSTTILNEAYQNVVNLLNESRANEKKLEAEIAALKKVNTESTKRLEEMSTYLKTQDHINILKLKERDLLLKELTEQINELRSQVKRDQKLLLEVRNGNALPVIESKKPPRRSSENNNKKIPNAQLHKLDLTIDENARPSTATGTRSFNMTDTLHLNRPSTSPSIGTGELETSHLPSRPVNLSQTLKVFCGSSPLGKPSLFESQGLGAYEYCDIRESKKDSNQVDILVLDRPERESNVKKEVTDLRKKITLLMAHQEIVMSRGRLGTQPPPSGQHRKKAG